MLWGLVKRHYRKEHLSSHSSDNCILSAISAFIYTFAGHDSVTRNITEDTRRSLPVNVDVWARDTHEQSLVETTYLFGGCSGDLTSDNTIYGMWTISLIHAASRAKIRSLSLKCILVTHTVAKHSLHKTEAMTMHHLSILYN